MSGGNLWGEVQRSRMKHSSNGAQEEVGCWPDWWVVMVGLAALLLFAPLHAQVVHFSGSGDSTADTGGAVVEVYGDSAVSRISVGPQQAHYVGLGREVTVGAATLTLGTSTPSLRLPTDLADTQRLLYVDGALLHVSAQGRTVETFAGVTGQDTNTNSIAAGTPLLLSSATVPTGRVVWQGMVVHGERRAMLLSAALLLRPHTLLALTNGMCDGKPVSRLLLSHTASSWNVEVNDTSGHLGLQPEQALQQAQLETIGLNAAALKRFGNWLTVSGSRREYDTSASGIAGVASRSTVLEGGASLHFGEFQAGVRLLGSKSGPAQDSGRAWLAGWTHGHTGAQATLLERTDALGVRTNTLQLDADRQLRRYVQGSLGVSVGNGSPSADGGVAVTGNWGSVHVHHVETYVPFGTSSGFQRVLTVAVHLNVRNADVGVARTSGAGLQNAWQGSVNGYEEVGVERASPVSAQSHSLARYRVEGVVLAGGKPVAGAAVAVGLQVVYTDSSGRWMARFNHNTPVSVSMQTADFLTEATYCSSEPARLVTPAIGAASMTSTVARCAAPAAAPRLVLETEDTRRNHALLHSMARLVKAAIRIWPRTVFA